MSGDIQRLQDRVAELEHILGLDRTLTSKIREMFALEPEHAALLAVLYRREFVTRDALYAVLCSDKPECDWPDIKTMDNRIFKIRRKLEGHGITIDTTVGEGWSMPAQSRATMRMLIEPRHDEVVERYRSVFGLQPKQAQILALMMDKPAVTMSGLRHITSSFNAAYWHIAQIRGALDEYEIEVSTSCGRWSLPEMAKEIIRKEMLQSFPKRKFEEIAGRRQAFLEGQ